MYFNFLEIVSDFSSTPYTYTLIPIHITLTRRYTNFHLFSYSRHSIYADVYIQTHAYTYIYFPCLNVCTYFLVSSAHLIGMFILLWFWQTFHRNLERSRCVCCACFPVVAIRSQCMVLVCVIREKASMEKATNPTQRKSLELKVKLWKKRRDFFRFLLVVQIKDVD